MTFRETPGFLNIFRAVYIKTASAAQCNKMLFFTQLLSSLYSSPLLSMVSFSMVSVVQGQLQSENIKWKVPEINIS